MNMKIISTFITISAAALLFTQADPALAVDLYDPLEGASIPVVIGRVIKAALGLSGSVALLMFIYGGFIWLTSMGNKDAIGRGKKTLTWAIIGLVVIFAAYIAVDLLLSALIEGATT